MSNITTSKESKVAVCKSYYKHPLDAMPVVEVEFIVERNEGKHPQTYTITDGYTGNSVNVNAAQVKALVNMAVEFGDL